MGEVLRVGGRVPELGRHQPHGGGEVVGVPLRVTDIAEALGTDQADVSDQVDRPGDPDLRRPQSVPDPVPELGGQEEGGVHLILLIGGAHHDTVRNDHTSIRQENL